MYRFTQVQQQKVLFWLVSSHILVTAASNYLVQPPLSIFNIHTTWGAFTFPLIFLVTDLTVRVLGPWLARKIISRVMLSVLLLSYAFPVLFSSSSWTSRVALSQFNSLVERIALASFPAYILDQILDIFVFTGLCCLKIWWTVPAVPTIFGNALDALMFFSIASYSGSDESMVAHWPGIALVDYLFKLIVCTLFSLPAYDMVLNILMKKLTALEQSDSENNTLILTQKSQPHTKKVV